MTDRHAGYVITLEEDVREDDAAAIKTALSMIKGVLSVEPVVSDPGLHIAEERAWHRIWKSWGDLLAADRDERHGKT